MRARHAFTIWELLIVVVIIGILAAIAIPNCNETCCRRSKHSRVLADMRSMATALEAYFVDNKTFPPAVPISAYSKKTKPIAQVKGTGLQTVPPALTTPIVYITYLPPDLFIADAGFPPAYFTDGKGWILFSPGPDLVFDIQDPAAVYAGEIGPITDKIVNLTYDPTNGLVSGGDIWRTRETGGNFVPPQK